MMAETPEKPRPLTLPWFKPLWRRVIVIAIIAVWCGWEWLYTHDQFWGMITLAALAYGVWIFIINFDNELAKETAKDANRNDDAKPKS
jgi:hypothetical protein